MEELLGVVLSFDLRMEDLNIYFKGGSKNRSIAYDKIRRFLMSHGYNPLDDSDYEHDKDTMQQCFNKLLLFNDGNPWFALCVKKVLITPKVLHKDYLELIKDNIDFKYKKEKELEFDKNK